MGQIILKRVSLTCLIVPHYYFIIDVIMFSSPWQFSRWSLFNYFIIIYIMHYMFPINNNKRLRIERTGMLRAMQHIKDIHIKHKQKVKGNSVLLF